MSDAPAKLPELQQASLDAETLEALLRDLDELTQVFQVVAKPNTRGEATPSGLTPESAVSMLLAEELRGVQIRYLYQGDEWWDTLIRTDSDIRLTRIRQTETTERVE